MKRFVEKSVLITGAGRGLGQQLALDFAREGANVTVNYSSSAEAAESSHVLSRGRCLRRRGQCHG
jgi:NAD(P)-dependent dehydrogenase (short-subunit alcohol dehydrogenase family)